jgi:hypothetical protein
MTHFTDPAHAVEEAQWLANHSGWRQAIVAHPKGYAVVAEHQSHSHEVLEVVEVVE